MNDELLADRALLHVRLPFAARADAVDTLRDFVRDVKTGRAAFTQTVTSPDGAKKKTSSGSFEFARPEPLPLRLHEAVRAAHRRPTARRSGSTTPT